MKTYQDIDTFYHDKPCINGVPSSNNRLIYSAYSKYLTPSPSNQDLLLRQIAFNRCVISDLPPIKVDRLPNKPYPPYSKDEVIGAVSQGFLNAQQLEQSHWNFCNFVNYIPKKLTLKKIYKAVKILYKIRKEHRNYVWENKLEDAYCLAFYLAPFDQYYVKKFCGEDTTIIQTLAFYLNFITTYFKGNKSVRLLLWLQCEDLNHWLLRFIPKNQWVKDYFEEDHIFVKNLK